MACSLPPSPCSEPHSLLVARQRLAVVPHLAHEVPQPPPRRSIPRVEAQRLRVALLRSGAPHEPLRTPQIAQVVVDVNLGEGCVQQWGGGEG